MNIPVILTNFKTALSGTGKNALVLAKIHESVSQKTGVSIAVAVQAVDIFRISQEVCIPVFAQYCDGISYGSHTGWMLPEALREAGASGVILNHSEHRFSERKKLISAVQRAKEVGLFVCVCAETDQEGKELSEMCPADVIAVEPPELIGGDISISTARPELISHSVEQISRVPVLVGAGVKNGEDVRIAKKLGAVGVLIASGITKAENPETALLDLAEGAKG